MSKDNALSVRSDDELLAFARIVLEGEDYEVVESDAGGFGFLLAENRYFIVAVATAPTIDQLLLAEGIVERSLRDQMAGGDLGSKKWDAYVILLTQERMPERRDATRDLFAINYNTSVVRRIAHSGVDNTLSSVRDALTPFVKPMPLHDPRLAEGAFESLERSLVANGIDDETARRAIEAFQQGAEFSDAF